MFFLALSLLVVFVNCSAEICIEEPFIGLLDCGDLSLKTIDGLFTTRHLWVRTVDFTENNLAVINITELLQVFPNLQHIDLRQNLAFDCTTIRDSRVRVRSDCIFPPFSGHGSLVFDTSCTVSRSVFAVSVGTASMDRQLNSSTSPLKLRFSTTPPFFGHSSSVFDTSSTLVTKASMLITTVKASSMVRQLMVNPSIPIFFQF